MGTALLSGEVLLAELVEAAESSGVQSLARVLMLSEDAHPVDQELRGALKALPAERVVCHTPQSPRKTSLTGRQQAIRHPEH
eukprot:9407894-Pyramimonas_sp.AAC.1